MKENIIRGKMRNLEGQIFMGHPLALLNSPSVGELLVVYSNPVFSTSLLMESRATCTGKTILGIS